MSDLKNLLGKVKLNIQNNNYKLAISDLEKILHMLKADYDSNINKIQSGKAFNKLLKVRRDLIAGNLSDESYDILKLEKPKADDDIDYNSTSNFFDSIDDEKNDEDEAKDEPKVEESKDEKPNDKLKDLDHQTKNLDLDDDPSLESLAKASEFQFNWNDIPTTKFEDIAGLEDVKEIVRLKVLLPLKHPELTTGYLNSGGGGVCLYGPPGTGKTMIAAAIANTIHAKFCSVTPSDLLHQGAGNTEKAVKALFEQARSFKCAVIYFDEMDSIAPKSTKSTYARQLRSEFLAQLQGISAYTQKSKNILFLICATNKPWDIDSAFLRPGRFGTKVYVGLPDDDARRYIITHHFDKLSKIGEVEIDPDIDIDYIVKKTNMFNCADVTNLLSAVEEISMRRAFIEDDNKKIIDKDFKTALNNITSSVQIDDIKKLDEWKKINDIQIIQNDESNESDDELDNLKENDDSNNDNNLDDVKPNDDNITLENKPEIDIPDIEVPEFMFDNKKDEESDDVDNKSNESDDDSKE